MKLAGFRLSSWSKFFYISEQEKKVLPWFRDQGDKNLRLNYDLDENSMVFDLGGYEGQWASDIFSMYCCSIHVFEPVEEFADKIIKRFSKNKKIIVLVTCALLLILGLAWSLIAIPDLKKKEDLKIKKKLPLLV